MAKHVVARVDEIPPGSRRRVHVEGRAIAVFNVEGAYHAARNACPHQGGPLPGGMIVGWSSSSGPGCFEYDASRKLVKCPWHGWEFELATGQSWFDPRRERVRRYPVTVEGGEALLPP